MLPSQRPATTPRYPIGTRVQVKPGVTVRGFEPILLEGCAGTVEALRSIGGRPVCQLRWDGRSLEALAGDYLALCSRDGVDPETIWLEEDHVAIDDGTPWPVEEPICEERPEPEEEEVGDHHARLRRAFGVGPDGSIPGISPASLHAYHRYLAARLIFPFTAYWGEIQVGPFSCRQFVITVTGLVEPDEANGPGTASDILCTGLDWESQTTIPLPLHSVSLRTDNRNDQLVHDYTYWREEWPAQETLDSWAEEERLWKEIESAGD
jgi:hypothetical protein